MRATRIAKLKRETLAVRLSVSEQLFTSAQAHTMADQRNRSSQELLQGAPATLPQLQQQQKPFPAGVKSPEGCILELLTHRQLYWSLLFLAKILYNHGEEGAFSSLAAEHQEP